MTGLSCAHDRTRVAYSGADPAPFVHPLHAVYLLLQAGTGLIPVFLFLMALIVLDSYKLVTLRSVLISILIGAAAAGASYLANTSLQSSLQLDRIVMMRYVAPTVEEFFKAIWIFWLVRTVRVGFAVDAAIHGFAIGAGFAVLENVYYLQALGESSIWTWVVRGFGTAVMHGACWLLRSQWYMCSRLGYLKPLDRPGNIP